MTPPETQEYIARRTPFQWLVRQQCFLSKLLIFRKPSTMAGAAPRVRLPSVAAAGEIGIFSVGQLYANNFCRRHDKLGLRYVCVNVHGNVFGNQCRSPNHPTRRQCMASDNIRTQQRSLAAALPLAGGGGKAAIFSAAQLADWELQRCAARQGDQNDRDAAPMVGAT